MLVLINRENFKSESDYQQALDTVSRNIAIHNKLNPEIEIPKEKALNVLKEKLIKNEE